MSPKFFTIEEAAKRLGIGEDELRQMRETGDLYGYRDANTWKFKSEDIEKLAAERGVPAPSDSAVRPDEAGLIDLPDIDDDDDSAESVLLSDEALGGSNPTTSSTIIGKSSSVPGDSDIELADDDPKKPGSDVKLVPGSGSDVELVAGEDTTPEADPEGATQLIDRDTLDSLESGSDAQSVDDLVLGEEAMELTLEGESGISLSGGDDEGETQLLDSDDSNVLGDTGSDITLSGDSGISLGEPSDSGLSLEGPGLDLQGSDLSLGEDEDTAELTGEDDFVLAPLDPIEDESEDSGSQVIALDADADEMDHSAATQLTDDLDYGGGGGGVAMLEEDTDGLVGMDVDEPRAMMTQSAAAPAGREAPYSIWNVLGLVACVLVLALTGMMQVELMMNIWSWDGTSPATSSIMNFVLSFFS